MGEDPLTIVNMIIFYNDFFQINFEENTKNENINIHIFELIY
jgi:hypothetical protein